jgi:glycosyltransferase involved in cell wall biosynthesis
MTNVTFSILITTKNRKDDLAFTLVKIQHLFERNDVNCIICDDGSSDGTVAFLESQYPKIQLIQNVVSKGLIFSRNRLLNLVKTEFAISIDDDLHFITQNALEIINIFFNNNPNVGVIGFRIFWNKLEPKSTISNEQLLRMQSFAGGAHAFRMSAWRDIPNYPAWFIFYGEENFASYELFKKGWEIIYLPEILVHHRVDLKSRRNNADYILRLRRSLRSGWCLFFLFYPVHLIARKMAYSIWMQFKLKVFKGDFKALQAICLALLDLLFWTPKILKNSNRLTLKEYNAYQKLPETKIYWKPEK